jgi:hypothetical protein
LILRRLTEHFRDQNWFAVGVDFVIVVVGVFIGIQVANWNDELADRRREHEILLNIIDDIRNDRAELASGIGFAERTIDAANYALAAAGLGPVQSITMPLEDIPQLYGYYFSVEEAAEPSAEVSTRLWSLSVVRYYPTQSNAALEALTTAGDLALIKNAELVRALQLYRMLWQGLEQSQESTYRPFRERAVFVGQEFGLSPFTEMDLGKYVALIADNPKLASALRTLLEYTVIHKSQLEAIDNKAAELLDLLEAGSDGR